MSHTTANDEGAAAEVSGSLHTPGPWHHDTRYHKIVSRAYEREVPIAELNAWEVDPQEAQANANLIAAAPDLWLAAIAALSLLAGSIDDEDRLLVTQQLMSACIRAEGTK